MKINIESKKGKKIRKKERKKEYEGKEESQKKDDQNDLRKKERKKERIFKGHDAEKPSKIRRETDQLIFSERVTPLRLFMFSSNAAEGK